MTNSVGDFIEKSIQICNIYTRGNTDLSRNLRRRRQRSHEVNFGGGNLLPVGVSTSVLRFLVIHHTICRINSFSVTFFGMGADDKARPFGQRFSDAVIAIIDTPVTIFRGEIHYY